MTYHFCEPLRAQLSAREGRSSKLFWQRHALCTQHGVADLSQRDQARGLHLAFFFYVYHCARYFPPTEGRVQVLQNVGITVEEYGLVPVPVNIRKRWHFVHLEPKLQVEYGGKIEEELSSMLSFCAVSFARFILANKRYGTGSF